MAGIGVEQRQLVAEQAEHLRVRLGGLKQPRDRIAGPCRGIERDGMVAQPRQRRDRVPAGDRVQLPPAVAQHRAHVEERLHPGPEAAA